MPFKTAGRRSTTSTTRPRISTFGACSPTTWRCIVRDGRATASGSRATKAEIFVSRDDLRDVKAMSIAELAETPVPQEELVKLCKGKQPGNHMANFFECVRDRSTPISDVYTHHRAMTTCHLANIAIRLNRPLKWDPEKEEIVGDSEANGWLRASNARVMKSKCEAAA